MAGKLSHPVPARPQNAPPAVGLFLAGVGAGLACVVVGTAIYVLFSSRHEEPPPLVEIPAGLSVPVPLPQIGAWWDSVPESNLAVTVALLTQMMPQDKALFDNLGDKSETMRLDALQKFLAKLPEMTRNPKSKLVLERLLIDCYVWEPAEKNVTPIKEWFVNQIPKSNAEYPRGYGGEDAERSFWALYLSMEILTHKDTRPERVRDLANELEEALGFTIDPSVPRAELTTRAEKLLALRCYRNLLPTAAKSVDHGLALRVVLVKHIGDKLPRTSRDKIDLHLAAQAFASAKICWPAYRWLLQDCLNSKDSATDQGIVALYASADAELVAKMEPILAGRWDDVLKDGTQKHEAKVRALRVKLGMPIPVDRPTQFEKAAREALAGAKSTPDKTTALLQETARLSHAATLACALSKKEAGYARFDDLIAEVPEIETDNPAMPPAKEDNAKKPDGPKAPGGDPVGKAGPKVIKDQLTPGAGSKVHVVSFRRGRTYSILMVSNFDNFLRLQNSRGVQLAQDDDSGGGLNALILFTAPYDDAFKIIATSFNGRLVGPYTLTIDETQGLGGPIVGLPFGPGFGGPLFPPPRPFFGKFPPPRMFPGPGPVMVPGQPVVVNPVQPKDQKPAEPQPATVAPPLVDEADLKNLGTNFAKTRSAAFHTIVAKLKGDLAEKDLTNAQAVRIAKYLVSIQDRNEADEAAAKLTPLAKSRNLMLAMADAVDLTEARKEASEIVVGKLLQQPLEFGKDAWRPACRKLLLLQALDQTGKKFGAEQAADFLRELYQEQAVLLGMDAKVLEPMTRPAQVMESMIQHVAEKLGTQHKDFLERVPRRLRAAQFAALNDLEHTVLLQRIWIDVLAVHLEQQSPQRAKEMRQVQADLKAADRAAANVLEQLRGGEEKLLRLWTLALDVK